MTSAASLTSKYRLRFRVRNNSRMNPPDRLILNIVADLKRDKNRCYYFKILVPVKQLKCLHQVVLFRTLISFCSSWNNCFRSFINKLCRRRGGNTRDKEETVSRHNWQLSHAHMSDVVRRVLAWMAQIGFVTIPNVDRRSNNLIAIHPPWSSRRGLLSRIPAVYQKH